MPSWQWQNKQVSVKQLNHVLLKRGETRGLYTDNRAEPNKPVRYSQTTRAQEVRLPGRPLYGNLPARSDCQ